MEFQLMPGESFVTAIMSALESYSCHRVSKPSDDRSWDLLVLSAVAANNEEVDEE
jgi:hypothetical protein